MFPAMAHRGHVHTGVSCPMFTAMGTGGICDVRHGYIRGYVDRGCPDRAKYRLYNDLRIL